MGPTMRPSELGQIVRLIFVSVLILAGSGVAISLGSITLHQLIAMR
jgi:hypothetical protein